MSKVKQYFTSRFGSEGSILECDWKALEIVAWALHTQDPVLLELLNSGQDMHKFLGGRVLGCKPEEVTKEQRQHLKPANFTLIYSGTDWNLVQKDGLEEAFAKKVYDTFWDTFKVSRKWADDLMKELDDASYSIDDSGNRESYYTGLTGRRWYFKNYPSKISSFCAENRIYTPMGFKYSEGMNHKIQGFATADLHLIALGHLWRKSLPYRDKLLLINTVHDSIIFDIRTKYLQKACIFIRNELYYVKEIMKQRFNINFNVPLELDFKVGKSWGEMKELELEVV